MGYDQLRDLSFFWESAEIPRALIRAQEWKLWRLEHQIKNTVSGRYMERKLTAKLWKLSRDFGAKTPART